MKWPQLISGPDDPGFDAAEEVGPVVRGGVAKRRWQGQGQERGQVEGRPETTRERLILRRRRELSWHKNRVVGRIIELNIDVFYFSRAEL